MEVDGEASEELIAVVSSNSSPPLEQDDNEPAGISEPFSPTKVLAVYSSSKTRQISREYT